MATMTGTNLLDSIIESAGVEVNALIQATLSAKLQQMIDNGTYSKLAAAIAMSGFSTTVNDATEIGALSDGIEVNAALIEAAVDQDAVDLIDFPAVEGTTASLSIADVTVAEDAGTATFTVTLNGDAPAAGESVTVDYATADGTATAGADYTATSGTLTFGEGVTEQTFTVAIAEDTEVEGDEAFTVTLSGETGTIGGETVTIFDGTAIGTITDDDVAPNPVDTYTLTAAASSVTEGDSIVFTVTAVDADGVATTVTADTDVKYQVAGVEVAGGTADPLTDLGIVNGTVTILEGESTGTITLTPSDDGVTEGYEGFNVSLLDASFATIVTSSNVVIEDVANAGQDFVLTPDPDAKVDFTGGAGNDTFTGLIDSTGTPAASTFTALDSIDGGDGDDVLNLNTITAVAGLPSVTVANIETMNIAAAAAFVGDVSSGYTGLTAVNLTQAGGDLSLTVADTTDVDVAGVVDTDADIVVIGGKSVTVTNKLDQDADSITVTGAGDVTINATDVLTSTIVSGTVGATTENTGVINITSTGEAIDTATVTDTMASIAVAGGTSITVTQSATSDMGDIATDTSAQVITQGAVTVLGGTTTTSVTVTQDAQIDDIAATVAVAAVAETAVVTFVDMKDGDDVTVNGLKFTASKDLVAADVATAFANLVASDTQELSSANGYYTGTNSTESYTTGAASGATVTYTCTNTDVDSLATGDFDIANTSTTSPAGTVTKVYTDGSNATLAVTGVLGVETGTVVIDDVLTATQAATITTVDVDGYGAASTVGATNSANALTDLTLANSGDAGAMTVTSTVSSLGLTLDNVSKNTTVGATATASTVTLTDTSLTSLNITTTGSDSFVALGAAQTTALVVDGTQALNLTGSTLSALETLTVTGSAGVTATASGATVTAVDTSATTGTSTITVDATKATFTGGAGVDNVTTSATAPTKAITLAGGDDSITLAAGTTAMGTAGTIDGGADTDTLVMVAADAATASAGTAFAGAVTDFENLTLKTGTAGTTGTQVTTLTFTDDNFSAGDTIVFDFTGTNTININQAYTGGSLSATLDAVATTLQSDANVTTAVNTSGVLVITGASGEVYTIGAEAGVDQVTALGGVTPTVTEDQGIEVDTIVFTDDAVGGGVMDTADTIALNADDTAVSEIWNTNLATTLGNVATAIAADGEIATATGTTTITVTAAAAGYDLVIDGFVFTNGGGAASAMTAVITETTVIGSKATILYTDGAGDAAMADGDSIAVVVGATTYTQAFSTDFATTLGALKDQISLTVGITASLGGTTITIVTDDTTTVVGGGTVTSAYTQYVTDVTMSQSTTTGLLGGDTIDLTKLGSYDYVTVGDNTALTLNTMLTGGTVVLDDDNGYTLVQVTDSEKVANTTDVLNVIVKGDEDATADTIGTIAAADVETINITMDNITAATNINTLATQTLTLVATSATKIDIGGDAPLTLTNTGNTKVTTIDASDMTAALTVTAAGTVVTTITGGSGNDVLTASTTGDVADILDGGSGNDSLYTNTTSAKLTGGAGNDKFYVNSHSDSSTTFSTIEDALSGDQIIFTVNANDDGTGAAETATFVNAMFTATAADSISGWVNAAINSAGNADAANAAVLTWFQYSGNTYIVETNHDAAGTADFDNSTDYVVKLTGLVDLSAASYNDSGIIEIA